MIDPSNITNYNRTKAELEEFLLFGIAVAGKNSKTTANRLECFIEWAESEFPIKARMGFTPFQLIRDLDEKLLAKVLRWLGFGCYNQRAKAFLSAANTDIDLQNCSISQLEDIHGVGAKTSRFFIMHSRPDARVAVLDVHILRWLRSKGINAPKQTPSSKKRYHELEMEFLRRADIIGRDPAELDLEIWNTYNRSNVIR